MNPNLKNTLPSSSMEEFRTAGSHPFGTVLLTITLTLLMTPLIGAAERTRTIEPELRHLIDGGADVVEMTLNSATGTPSLLRIEAGSLPLEGTSPKRRTTSFFTAYGETFGIGDPALELEFARSAVDGLGMTHLTYRQIYQGVPVFASELKVHFDANDELVAVNGTFVSGIRLDASPIIESSEAESLALSVVAKDHRLRPTHLVATLPELLVYRTGLVRGVPGTNHLAWKVEVSDSLLVREYIFVDAHSGVVLDRHPGIHDLNRIIHHETYGNRIWQEGDSTPYTGLSGGKNDDVNQLIATAEQTFELYSNITNGDYLSYDGNDKAMNSVYEAEADPPCDESLNAWWNGRSTNYCAGLAVDDVIAHEWTHAYTDYNHNLIYQWQPGALNESFSDIFGEIVDVLNGSGFDQPDGARSDGECSVYFSRPLPGLEVSAPAAIVGNYATRGAEFNPDGPRSVSGMVELVDDGTATATDGCEALQGFTSGNIALIDRGNCAFVDKAANAQEAGAVGVIIANHEGDEMFTMAGDKPSGYDTPAAFVARSTGETFKGYLDEGVTATLSIAGSTDVSVRWLVSEDGAAGAFRDMWNPVCMGDPGRVLEAAYVCSDDDNGGIHSNSGIPNHAFALIVDGGSYNGYTVSGIGLTRAAHIYWRAMSVYQSPTTKFADHADIIELSCTDLIDATLTNLETGGTTAAVISANHCNQVAKAMLAVEMREDPVQCNFKPVLEPDAPEIKNTTEVYSESFDGAASISGWTLSNEGVFEEYSPRDWLWTEVLPDDGQSGALFALDSPTLGNCTSYDQSGVMRAESPPVSIPISTSKTYLVFDHYVATEDGWDGGNLKISVNGGTYVLVPTEAFQFNPYNATLVESVVIDEEETENTNPLAGEAAFTGINEGELAGSWGQSQVDLDSLASPGDTIRIRFDFGVDGCSGVDGWYVDNFKVLADGGPSAAVRQAGRRVRPGN